MGQNTVRQPMKKLSLIDDEVIVGVSGPGTLAQRFTGEIQRLYRYAVEHGDELQYIACFCGCYRFGHKSNRDCYVKAFNAGGTLTFTSHAAT